MSRSVACSIDECEKPRVARGWCHQHYKRWQLYGDPTIILTDQGKPPIDRFLKRVAMAAPGGCWPWIGHCGKNGYGQFFADGAFISAHRFSYLYFVGPIPEGLHIDHLCRVRNCVNPTHLEPVVCRENVLRGEGLAAKNAKQTHCLRGHPFEGDNLRFDDKGRRVCRACRRLSSKRQSDKRRGLVSP